ncbi:MAG: peptide deformylase [Candidatus Nomurabacteria bacterium]|jgi:peptide deformylase|nr:peptide deformylase [Candidatus Nomurabacteria bacterium]
MEAEIEAKDRKVLELRRLGDPILRAKAKTLTKSEVLLPETQALIDNMYYTCAEKDYGVGLSASQVGQNLAISIVAIKPTPTRPNSVPFDEVLINTKIVEAFGEPTLKWEGCCSIGGPAFESLIFGLVPRYKKVRIKYLDRHGEPQEKTVKDFVAHVVQHETDHLGGILFTDIADPQSLMMGDEYKKRITEARK